MIKAEEDKFRWSALPPLPLIGEGTALVESSEHYVARLAWTVGVSIRVLCPPTFSRSGNLHGGQFSGASGFCGPGRQFKRRIEHIERLTGSDRLRCGSFWVLDEILAVTGVGRNTKQQRWCPQCFLEWDENASCEPLIWMVDLQQTCMIHACDLESACRSCGSTQPAGRDYRRRRHCCRCEASLSGKGVSAARSGHHLWMEQRLSELIELCATPGQQQIAFESYDAFVRGLVEISSQQQHLPATLRAAVARMRSNAIRGRVTLRTLVNLCALQGITIPQMLLDPRSAASRPLIDLWANYQALEFPNGRHASKLLAYQRCTNEMLRMCRGGYLPPMSFVLRQMKLNRDMAREMCVDSYEEYERLYQGQGAYSSRVHKDRAFAHALRMIEAENVNPFAPCDTKKMARRVAIVANVPLAVAGAVTRMAVNSRRALERAKAALLGSTQAGVSTP
jgi:hypothetical protein